MDKEVGKKRGGEREGTKNNDKRRLRLFSREFPKSSLVCLYSESFRLLMEDSFHRTDRKKKELSLESKIKEFREQYNNITCAEFKTMLCEIVKNLNCLVKTPKQENGYKAIILVTSKLKVPGSSLGRVSITVVSRSIPEFL
jgi:hypothetical protein